MNEKDLKIKIEDKKHIYGTWGKRNRASKRLVIFVHGFTGHKDEHILFNGSKFLAEKGFDTYRFDLYAGAKKDSRHFTETSISKHGEDIDTVVKFFRKNYQKIFVIGHSYGGTSLLFTNQIKIDGYIFWDASYIDPKIMDDKFKISKESGKYILDWGIEYLVGKKFVDELKNFPDCGKLVKEINKPVLFITAEKGNYKAGLKYFKAANNPKKLVNIKIANHNFNNWKNEERLFKGTWDWLKKS